MTAPVPGTPVVQGVAGGNQDISITLSALGTISAGDVIIVDVQAVAATVVTSWTQQIGPTFIKEYENTATTASNSVWRRVCDGSESGTITFRRNTTNNNAVMVVTKISGADTTTPIVVVDVATGTGTSITLPTLASVNGNTLSLQRCSFQSVLAGVTWTQPAGVTKIFSGQATGQGVAVVVGTETVPSGSTGNQAWTHTTSTATRGVHILVNPVLGSPPAGVPLTSVEVGGVEKDIAVSSVMIGGVEKTLASASVMIGGVEKTVT